MSPNLRRAARAALAAAPLLLGGCATIFTGTSDRIAFESNVPRVRLTVDGEYRGELPLTLELPRKTPEGGRFLARFERQGYVTQQFELGRTFNLVALLGIPVFPIALPVDWASGSLERFEPTSYHVLMVADPGARAGAASDLVCRADAR